VQLDADEGIRPLDPDLIRKLPPATPDGVHSIAAQTHPADGCAGALVTSTERARELAAGQGVVRILATGYARVAKTHMPEAPVPAALAALADAGLDISQADVVTTHNPFAVNDIYFSYWGRCAMAEAMVWCFAPCAHSGSYRPMICCTRISASGPSPS